MNAAADTTYAKAKLAGLIALLAGCFLFYFAQPLTALVKVWYTNDDYSYAFAIPLVSAYAIWRKRRQIRATALNVNWYGAVFFIFFYLISAYGILGSSPSAVRPAIPLILLSMVLFLCGWDLMRLLLFPIGLLIFMVPLPTIVETGIGVPLRLLSTQIGVLLLRLVGVSVYVEGNIIDLGVTQLQVVDACSGLRYLLPLLALGIIFVYFREKNRWKQVVLVFSTLPIAVFLNGMRIAVTGFLAQHYDLAIADHFFHGFSGWLFFVFAILLIVLLHIGLEWFASSESENSQERAVTAQTSKMETAGFMRIPIAMILSVCVLFLAGGIWNARIATLPPVGIQGGFDSFPSALDGWSGRSETVDVRIIEQSGAQEAFNAAYFNASGEIVSLYMGYRSSPFTESENFFHSPNVCMPSLGWKTLAVSKHTIKNIPGFGRLSVSKMIIEKAGVRQLVYYWFQTKNRMAANVHQNRFHLSLHALARDNTFDLFVRPITPLGSGEKVSNAEKRLDGFVRDLMEALMPFLDNQTLLPKPVG